MTNKQRDEAMKVWLYAYDIVYFQDIVKRLKQAQEWTDFTGYVYKRRDPKEERLALRDWEIYKKCNFK